MRAITWAIRVTFANGGEAFLRHGRVIGRGPIATFHSKAKAEQEAEFVREGCSSEDVVTVIERSHGRRDRAVAWAAKGYGLSMGLPTDGAEPALREQTCVVVEQATVYRAVGGRRYFTKASALRGYAKVKLRRKHPCECEDQDYTTGYGCYSCGCYAIYERVLPRYLRRLKRSGWAVLASSQSAEKEKKP